MLNVIIDNVIRQIIVLLGGLSKSFQMGLFNWNGNLINVIIPELWSDMIWPKVITLSVLIKIWALKVPFFKLLTFGVISLQAMIRYQFYHGIIICLSSSKCQLFILQKVLFQTGCNSTGFKLVENRLRRVLKLIGWYDMFIVMNNLK